jgi:hypothetical protein
MQKPKCEASLLLCSILSCIVQKRSRENGSEGDWEGFVEREIEREVENQVLGDGGDGGEFRTSFASD